MKYNDIVYCIKCGRPLMVIAISDNEDLKSVWTDKGWYCYPCLQNRCLKEMESAFKGGLK